MYSPTGYALTRVYVICTTHEIQQGESLQSKATIDAAVLKEHL